METSNCCLYNHTEIAEKCSLNENKSENITAYWDKFENDNSKFLIGSAKHILLSDEVH